ncbi:hypothetical protein [Flexivirga caeni]|uniref:Glycosyltransferase RgtA/B/C/D-like domain-containing protein n=1 Tax=Flexivirga caeni TaxID=2294115 RepID=A0A3M9MID5_9MICO|nr:hypothetical protein [Flexivirga caeni]RNI24593.1 hypothetical protein EFY87_02435 [Flexivirga caeni]
MTRLGRRGIGAIVGLLCGVLALGPALGKGFLLRYDLVFVPRLALSDRTLGVDGSVPRAVPNDFVVAVLSHLAPGWIVEKCLLLAVFVLAGAGVGALSRSRLGAAAAALVACWNPYVAERLSIGHWGYLLGYACVPFLVRAAGDVRAGRRRAGARLGVWLLLSAATGSTGAVLGMIATLAVLLVPSRGNRLERGELAWAAGVFVLANATWWFSYLFLAPSQSTSQLGVDAFMSRADTPWGVVGSLLTGGGIWNSGVWFAERSSVVVSCLALLAVLLCVAVAVADRVWREGPALGGLVVAGLLGLVLAAASALPVGRELMTAVITDLPGGGLLRDAQKFAGLWLILVAVLGGRLVERVRRFGVSAGVQGGVAVALVVASWPVVTLTGFAWGAGGAFRAVDYPPAYTAMAARIDALPAGAVAVFPWSQYRQYGWDDDVVLLDPWQRLVDRNVLVNDDLPLVGGQVVPGESPQAARITAAVHSGRDILPTLREQGVRYVLVETDQPVGAGEPDLSSVRRIAAEPGLRLYDLGGDVRGPAPGPGDRYTGWLLAALALLGVAARLVLDSLRDIRTFALTRG